MENGEVWVVEKKGKSEKCVKVYYSFLNKQLGLT
jgi:hypothetical protein